MSESTLIKEFNNRDVQRLRNLVSKNYGSSTQTQVGYNKQYTEHKEGDLWEENGRNWTIKNGIKQTVTKFDELKQMLILPLLCPHCKQPMSNSDVNKKLYSIHNKCMDCVIQYETELKRDGKYKEYESNIIKGNISGYLKDLELVFFDTFINNSNESIVTENGDIEQWVGGNYDKTELINKFQEGINQIKEKLDI